MISLHILHELMDNVVSNVVHTVIVISVFGEISLHLIIHSNAVFVTDHFYFRIFDGGQRICHHRKSGDSGSEPPGHLFVVERHLKSLIGIFVVHVVNDVQCIDIDLSQPFHHITETFHDFIIVQIFCSDGAEFRSHLFFGDFVHAAVDGIEQTFRQVCPGAEELHFFAQAHRGYTAGNGIIVSVGHPHQVVVLILDGRGGDGGFCAEPFEILRKPGGPQHGQVRLRRSSQIFQGVQVTVRHTGYHMTSVDAHTADGFGYPGGISGEKGIVFRCPCEFYQTQLHDEMIYKFLDLFLCKGSVLQISFGINIQKGGGASQGHGSAVLLFDGCQIAEVQPLNGFLHIGGRAGNVIAVNISQLF